MNLPEQPHEVMHGQARRGGHLLEPDVALVAGMNEIDGERNAPADFDASRGLHALQGQRQCSGATVLDQHARGEHLQLFFVPLLAKAGRNDCASNGHACAGQSKAADKKEWIKVPVGTCDRIVGGSTKA